MGEEAPKSGVVSLVSNLVLVGTAGWGLKSCLDHPFICAGFGLFVVRGIVGTVAYFRTQNDSSRTELEKTIEDTLDRALTDLMYPLFAMEIMNVTNFQPSEIKYLNIIFPTIDLFLVDLSKSLISATHGVAAILVIICDFNESHWYYIFSLLGYFAEQCIDDKMSEASRINIQTICVLLYAALINETLADLLLE